MRVASVNQDPGIRPGKSKGAAIHLAAVRHAMQGLGVEVVALDEPDAGDLERSLAAAHAEAPLDLVYERYALGARTASDFCATHAVPRVLEVNAPLAEEAERYRETPRSADHREADRASFSRATRVFAVSSAVARYSVERGAVPGVVEVVPNAVDAELFRPERRHEAPRDLATVGSRFVVGFHGRLRPWHGFEALVRVFARLLESGVDAHLLTVGHGDFASAIDRALPADRVTHLEWLPHDEVGRVVARFDALPLTYPADLPCYFSPLKLMEAMAAGVTPVVPALGDLEDVVRHGVDGLVYPAGDEDACFDALRSLANGLEVRQCLAAEAVRTARGHSWRAVALRALEAAPEVRA